MKKIEFTAAVILSLLAIIASTEEQTLKTPTGEQLPIITMLKTKAEGKTGHERIILELTTIDSSILQYFFEKLSERFAQTAMYIAVPELFKVTPA